ncbi:hypothetical protein [Mycolicibacterium mageritense]|uniref:hypothetical protein n=1 Tax=Mycolicibacterium mageritense TaxID=53462 RepID=UPI0011DB73A2|nr:hypothetical protein [Mycolicibacterium mageritense]TXI59719.1 MAG: hypothetical protein E6Q55_21170 [Mycolicibacterium mageritense]
MSKKNQTLTKAETMEAIDRLAAQAYAATTMTTRTGIQSAAERVPHSGLWQSLRETAAHRMAHMQNLIDELGPDFTFEQERVHLLSQWDQEQSGLTGADVLNGAPVTREAVRRAGRHQARDFEWTPVREQQTNDRGITVTVSGRTGSGKGLLIRQLVEAWNGEATVTRVDGDQYRVVFLRSKQPPLGELLPV